MPTLSVYHLIPPAGAANLSFHFGRQGIGLEETDETLASDSFFAALVVQAALNDPRRTADGAPVWVEPFLADQPPLRHSSLLPRIGDLPLLPRPLLPIHLPPTAELAGKQLKKLRYLSPSLFVAVCKGETLPADPISLQQGKIWLSEEDARRLPAPWKQTATESSDAWRARLTATPLWHVEATPHVTLDRLSAASAYYEVGRISFAVGAGLSLLVAFADAQARPSFEHLLTLLGESGLGGKRTNGYGAFAWQHGTALTLDLPSPHKRAVLLSRYIPTPTELPLVRNERSTYQLTRVSGWFLAADGSTYRRQAVMMLTEGAVLVCDERLPGGQILDVRPDASVSHPIYRSGLALAVGLPADSK
jgi:CRISPR-associated protein Csm4